MDLELSQLDKIYLNNLADYNRVVNQRKPAFKRDGFQEKFKDTLEIWDMQLVRYGERVMKGRKKFLREINEIVGDIHGKLTGGRERLVMEYEPSTGELSLEEAVRRNRERDIRMKSTSSAGPHRDDICFKIKDMDIRKFGSQGQQRTAALS